MIEVMVINLNGQLIKEMIVYLSVIKIQSISISFLMFDGIIKYN